MFFRRVVELPPIACVAAGCFHSAALDRTGALWVWTSKQSLSWASSAPQRVEDLPPLIKIACGHDFLMGEAAEGLWALGDNTSGQLGLGHTDKVLIPTLVSVKELSEGPLRCLSALSKSCLLVDCQGSMYSAGNNSDGELGRLGEGSVFSLVTHVPPVLIAACGFSHTLALDEAGCVWAWGDGQYGQLGTGNLNNQPKPALVTSLEGIGAVVCSGIHSLAVSSASEGVLLVFGDNSHGQLGIDIQDKATPTLCPIQPALPHPVRSRQKSARS